MEAQSLYFYNKRITLAAFAALLISARFSFSANYDPNKLDLDLWKSPINQLLPTSPDNNNGGNSLFSSSQSQNKQFYAGTNGGGGGNLSPAAVQTTQYGQQQTYRSIEHPQNFPPNVNGQQQQFNNPRQNQLQVNSSAYEFQLQQARPAGSGTGYGTAAQSDEGANVNVQLRSYSNPSFLIGPNQLCTCPQGNQQCVQKTGYRGNTCLVGFTVLVSSAEDPIAFDFTSYFPLNQLGQVGIEYQSEFQKRFDFHLDSRPTSIVVLVHNLGPIVNAQTGNIEHTNAVQHVDTFFKYLDGVTGGISGGGNFGGIDQQQQLQLQGSILKTQLSLSYSVSCRGRGLGPGCDLACNSSSINSATAVCQSQKTGYFSLCRWVSGRTQVVDCKNCPWGIKENAYCMDENGGVLESNHAGVVSTDFRTATIALGILCGLLVFCLLGSALLLFSRFWQKNGRRREPRSTRSTLETSHFVAGSAEKTPATNTNRPPLIASLNKADIPPPYSITHQQTGGGLTIYDQPTAVTRSNTGTPAPSTAGEGNGSAIRIPVPIHQKNKPKLRSNYQALPALANPSAFNNNDASFSTNFSHTPSVSADV